MKQDLGLRVYRPTPVQELSDVDMDRRKEAYTALLQTFNTIPKRGKIIFSDECAIYKSSRARNVVFWSKENPHFYDELENNPPHLMIWAALDSRHLFGPFFFDGVVNQLRYLDMLQTWFLPLLREHGIEETCWFQQDGHLPIMPLQYANILMKSFLGDGLVVALLCCQHHLPGHLKAQTSAHVIIRYGGS